MVPPAAADDGPVVNVGLTGDTHVAHKYTVVTHAAIVRHVHVRHYKSVASDAGNPLAAGLGATVDGGALAYVHPVSYLHPGHLAVELEVLRDGAHHGSGEHIAVTSHFDIREDGGVRKYLAAGTDLYIVVDECVRTYLNVVRKAGAGMYCC